MAAAGPRATPLGPGAGPPGPTSPRAGVRRVGWVWPLTPRPIVVHPFRAPAGPYGPGHRGVDLSAQVAAAVRSPALGVVSFAGVVADRGVIVVDHGGGVRSTFEPVVGWLPVGTRVNAGDRVASLAASSWHCGSSCLHWGVRVGAEYVDPLRYLGPVRVVLLPMD
ncbi:MAG: peptidoglycan DD-metalloendopeptidase family protein [Dermatophilaceae bacterium]